MKMWDKIKKPSTKKKRVPPTISSLPQVVHILPTGQKSKNTSLLPKVIMDTRNEHPEIMAPALSLQGHSVSNENRLPNYPTSWDSIHNHSTGKTSMDCEVKLSVLSNENYRLSESRQDSFSGSSVASRKMSFQSREAPPEVARSQVLAHNRSFRAKHQAKHTKFTLRPKSIVRKWNRYADLEEKGLAASPRHRTKLAKSLHLELAPTISSDSNDDVVVVPLEDSVPMEEEAEHNVAAMQEPCPNRDAQEHKKENETVAAMESDSMLVGERILTPCQESCANRDVQVDDSMEVTLEDDSVPSTSHSPALVICKDDIQRITENGFPASVLDEENEPVQDPSKDEHTTKATLCTANESDSASVSSISEYETDWSNQNKQTDTPHECSRQEEIVTLSLAQILVQSYQPDPDNPGYWKKKGADNEPKANPPKSFLRKDAPLPTLNTFLAEVTARRNEIFTKSNEAQVQECGNGKPDSNVDWYGAKRPEKQVHQTSNLGQKTNPSRPKDFFAELEAKQRDIAGRPHIDKPHQKRVVVCKPSSAGSANDLLSELKAKQQEITQKSILPPEQKEASVNETGTGFLPDLMTELKAKQREIKTRPPSPPKRVDPIAAKNSTGSKPGHMSELKAKQRAIEDRFYARLANLQNTLRGNAAVVIPKKS